MTNTNVLRLLAAFLEHENFHAQHNPTRTPMPPRLRMALHQIEAKVIHKLKPHLELLDAYRWHQISARRQEQALSALRDGGLQQDMLLVQVDFKENLRYPLSASLLLSVMFCLFWLEDIF